MRVEEEVVLLEEQLAAAHADIEQLQSRLSEAEARASGRDAELAEIQGRLETTLAELAERQSQQMAQSTELAEAKTALESMEERVREAAGRYRDAVLARETDLPGDLVAGDTIDAIDESLKTARETVAQIRQHLEQQAQSQRVPPGAPVRTGPDLSALSAAEKIRLGLQQS
jgi:hypothetical protein